MNVEIRESGLGRPNPDFLRSTFARISAPQPSAFDAFSLLELLVVIGLAAGLMLAFARPPQSDPASAVDAARATLLSTLSSARLRAMSGGSAVRLLIQADPLSAAGQGRFRRELVLQQESAPGTWNTVQRFVLPAQVVVLPHRLRVPPGFFADSSAWNDPISGAPVQSSALSQLSVWVGIDGAAAEWWDIIILTGNGTTGNAGSLYVAATVPRPGAGDGGSPVEARAPELARGITLSSYGIASAL